jgi:hypothetical protein
MVLVEQQEVMELAVAAVDLVQQAVLETHLAQPLHKEIMVDPTVVLLLTMLEVAEVEQVLSEKMFSMMEQRGLQPVQVVMVWYLVLQEYH